MAYRPHAVAALASRRTDTGADHRRHAQVLIIIILGADQRDGRHAHVAARAGLVVVRRGLGDRLGLLDVIHHAFFAPLGVDALPAESLPTLVTELKATQAKRRMKAAFLAVQAGNKLSHILTTDGLGGH